MLNNPYFNSGGINTSDATATASDISYGKTAYVKGEKIKGSLDITKHLDVQGKEVYIQNEDTNFYFVMSGTNIDKDYKVPKGAEIEVYHTQDYVAKTIGITADKIAKGNTILGIEGTAEAGTSSTTDATATAADIVENKTAYIATGKTTGTIKDGRGANAVIDSSTSAYNSGNGLYCKIRSDMSPRAIDTNSNIIVPNSFAQSLYQINAEKIVSGYNIAGIDGTASPIDDFLRGSEIKTFTKSDAVDNIYAFTSTTTAASSRLLMMGFCVLYQRTSSQIGNFGNKSNYEIIDSAGFLMPLVPSSSSATGTNSSNYVQTPSNSKLSLNIVVQQTGAAGSMPCKCTMTVNVDCSSLEDEEYKIALYYYNLNQKKQL